MPLPRVQYLALLLLIASASHGAVAADAAPPDGLAACQSCHGPAGISSTPGIPHLAGQRRDYLMRQLKNFRSGDRKNDLMSAIASQLSDERIDAYASYWSSQPPGPVPAHAGAQPAPALPSRMGFPEGFPRGYTRYTVEEDAKDLQVVERYANRAAVDAARAGRPLPDGSVLLSVTRSATKDGQGKLVAGDAVSYAGMESRAGCGEAIPALLRNGNWDYAIFNREGKRNDAVNQAACLACHRPVASSSFVFTLKAIAAVQAP